MALAYIRAYQPHPHEVRNHKRQNLQIQRLIPSQPGPGSLRSKCFRAVSEQKTRNECQKTARKMWRAKERGGGGEERKRTSPPRLFHFWLSSHFSPDEDQKSNSSSFLVLFLFRNHTETLGTQATAPMGDSSLTWTIQGIMQAKLLLAFTFPATREAD